jgi:hypothetical protein
MPGMWGSPARWCSRVVPRQGNPLLETLLPAVSEGCTGLYAAVRGIGGAGGPAYVHMVDSVVVAGIP